MKEMMKHTLLYIAVSGMTLLTSCQLGKHYTRPDLHLPQQLDKHLMRLQAKRVILQPVPSSFRIRQKEQKYEHEH